MMKLLTILTPLLFIINILYFIVNKDRLQKKSFEKNIESVKFSEVLFYYINLFFYIFILLGTFTGDNICIVLFVLYLIKFPIYHINKKIYKVYSYLYPYMNIIILLYSIFQISLSVAQL
jgi:hypothetical protein